MDSEEGRVGVGWEGKDPNCVSEHRRSAKKRRIQNPKMPVFASKSRMKKKKKKSSCWRKRRWRCWRY